MSKVDLVVFGATGFTGKKVVEELARGEKKYAGISWAVAGRAEKKLEAVLNEVAQKTGADLSGVRRIVADVGDNDSLKSMCSQARVVVNVCGPYRLYGEPVVRAAIDSKAHYVDVSGEPQFMETMQIEYGAQARDANVCVVSACGWDSVPNDMGVVFLDQNFGGTLNSVESYISTKIAPEVAWQAFSRGSVNYGTWESLVYGLAHYDELGSLRKKLYPTSMPSFKPKLQNKVLPHKEGGHWCIPFLGADNSIVYRTQRTLYETENKRPAQFRAYLKFPNLLYVAMLYVFGTIIMLLSKWQFTRQWLLDYPRIFSCGMVTRQGPPQEVMDNTRFQFKLVGKGWAAGEDVDTTEPTKTVVATVAGRDPGYGFTALALTQCAATILRERDSMPKEGGVMTTGVAFQRTNLIKNIQDSNFEVKFEIVEPK
ncbi:lipid droplet localized protein-like [Ostrinia furnacalis]|uniref:lipid droplet localized protein-like n=1 Tax=Ostrinia furnacalis TaxID=93504 RepID=UPI001038DC48|nr:lipid droplet localized protein-like [Ostrinia furnacalis]XP_028161280.1 lipid droplet localized protein-like [Ostrinia furnacalis]